MPGPAARDRRVSVKICGITTAADAEYAIECGADALGFNLFVGSSRYLDVEAARAWLTNLPPEVTKVAILVDPPWERAVTISRYPFIDSLQLHGDESPEFCRRAAARGIQFTKALRVSDETNSIEKREYFTKSVLLDSSSGSGFGGSGKTFDWDRARQFIERNPDLRVTLAGGLTPENVARAIEEVGPAWVDVTTGVESSPGRKDRARLAAFISAVRSTEMVGG